MLCSVPRRHQQPPRPVRGMPAALDDAALGSVIRSFGSSAKLGIKALTAEDAAYG